MGETERRHLHYSPRRREQVKRWANEVLDRRPCADTETCDEAIASLLWIRECEARQASNRSVRRTNAEMEAEKQRLRL